MEVKILRKFHDKADFNKVYLVGETVTFDEERANELVKLGLVEPVQEEADAETDTETDTEAEAEESVEPVEEAAPAEEAAEVAEDAKDEE